MIVHAREAFVATALLLLAAPAARAQSATTGAIAGVVRDASGAVLPGVTVEAASPALIERVRAATSDAQGNYRIIELRPGTYSVTFTLPGFSTVRREGIELTTGFTAAVNADMAVGALEETIVVTGASPVVDVQNVRTQNVLSRDMVDSLPTNRTYDGFAALTLGATVTGSQDVGGNKGDSAVSLNIHGAQPGDGKLKIDGMNMNIPRRHAGGQQNTFTVNQMAVQETVLETSGISAESETGNVQVNYVPKEGSNSVRASFFGTFTNGDLQGDNLNDEIRARGLTLAPQIDRVYDVGFGVGGPVMRDRLWFFNAWRRRGAYEFPAGGVPFNRLHGSMFYEPDLSRPGGRAETGGWDDTMRFTWQAAPKHKVTFSGALQQTCLCSYGLTSVTSPEATTAIEWGGHEPGPTWYFQSTWNSPVTNRVLLEAGMNYMANKTAFTRRYGVTQDDISINDTLLGIRYNASTIYRERGTSYPTFSTRASISYVPGSHAFKVGAQTFRGVTTDIFTVNNQSVSYTFRGGVPISLTQYVHPYTVRSEVLMVGLYAQDQWTIERFTLNLGVRFDYLEGHVPAAELQASRFRPAVRFDAVEEIPKWTDLNPRLGLAYDLFGNGRTALKVSLGRYVQSAGTGLAEDQNPANALVTNATRNWTDSNRNYVPDCDLHVPTANGECGGLNNLSFGTVGRATNLDPAIRKGFGVRDFNWELATTVQHEVRPGTALTVGYFRRWFGNQFVLNQQYLTRNLAVSPTDFDPFCITAPVDSRLPGGGGGPVCDLYDISPAKFGQVDQLVTYQKNFGDRSEFYNGIDVGLNSRFGRGGVLGGGLSVGEKVVDRCFVVDSPGEMRFCKTTEPWWDRNGQIKMHVSYPLPGDVFVSAVYQNLGGAVISANYQATNAEVVPTLGRNLGSCRGAAVCNGTVTIPLIEPFTMFEGRMNQVDLRFTKGFRIGTARVRGMFDIYNLFNDAAILGVNTTFGPNWLRPTSVLSPRVFKFGGQLDF